METDTRGPAHQGSQNQVAPSDDPQASRSAGKHFWCATIASSALLWSSQPPWCAWPMAFIALLPFFTLASRDHFSRRQVGVLYLVSFVYWAITLQGLRHAHPALYLGWIGLAAYLAIYRVLFVYSMWRLASFTKQNAPASSQLPAIAAITIPILWVATECLQNYVLTGISAVMLGHTMADVPLMIQIADLGGSYSVSFVIASLNVALYQTLQFFLSRRAAGDQGGQSLPFPTASVATGVLLIIATLGYGRYRLSYQTTDPKATLALIGLNEDVNYEQPPERELEIFDAYVRQSIKSLRSTSEKVDAVVWPESMFNGTLPYMMGDASGTMAKQQRLSKFEFDSLLMERQRAFQVRAERIQTMLAAVNENVQPNLIAGCGVVDYGETTKAYSGVVHLGPGGQLLDWYGKTHLVMFGEYFPLVKHLPIIKDMVPQEMGLTLGDGPKVFRVGAGSVSPNICIETAVERVTINQFRKLIENNQPLPEAIVTVTNDGWFDDSSVVQHHKRCAQLVAVACRRPILSAANNGPTVWIDSFGQIQSELPQGSEGQVIARPRVDDRISPVMTLADWPARFCVLFLLGVLLRRRPIKPSDSE